MESRTSCPARSGGKARLHPTPPIRRRQRILQGEEGGRHGETIPGFEEVSERTTPTPKLLAFGRDINQDGWDDILILGFPGEKSSWYENPKGAPPYGPNTSPWTSPTMSRRPFWISPATDVLKSSAPRREPMDMPLRTRRTRPSRGRGMRSRPTTTTTSLHTAWGGRCQRRWSGGPDGKGWMVGNNRPRLPGIPSGNSTNSRSAWADHKCMPTTSMGTGSTT